MIRTTLFCTALLLVPTATWAQVYKCTDAAGKVSYQNIPCTGTRQDQPVILKDPALTEKEKFNAAAYAAGTTPDEARRQIEAARQAKQNGTQNPNQQQAAQPATQQQEQVGGAYRCTRIDGTTFVRSNPCPARASVSVNGTTVTGIPASGSVDGTVQQQAISREQACAEAKKQKDAAEKSHAARHMSLPAEFRKALDKNISDVCR